MKTLQKEVARTGRPRNALRRLSALQVSCLGNTIAVESEGARTRTLKREERCIVNCFQRSVVNVEEFQVRKMTMGEKKSKTCRRRYDILIDCSNGYLVRGMINQGGIMI